ncbi:MAG: lasso peptide biosynthesis B2 protein [Halioglobus sp.]
MNRLQKFIVLSPRQKLLFFRAWRLLAVYQLTLVCRPLKRITQALSHSNGVQPSSPESSDQQAVAAELGRLVAYAAVATPWPSRCLVQVLVVQRLMAEQHIPGQILIGVSPSAGGNEHEETFGAHAWLQCGDLIVSGESGSEQYQVISSYAWDGSP